MDFEHIEEGKLNRTERQKICIGGKGINVSLALKNLKVESIPIIVVGGFTGDFIVNLLQRDFHTKIFQINNPTRINVKIKCQEQETEYNGKNEIDGKTVSDIHSYLLTLKEEDYLIISGSGSLSIYKEILSSLKCHLILDVDGNLLKNLLYLKPWLVKPNDEELKAISNKKEEAYKILLKYCQYVLHTQGKQGATFLSGKERCRGIAHQVKPISTVGCGDAALAGFLAYYFSGHTIEDSLSFSNECGSFRAKNGGFLIQY